MADEKTPPASRRANVHQIEDIAGAIATELELEIVAVTYGREPGGHVLSVAIDSPTGVNVEDCAAMSERLSARLDELDLLSEEHRLEVCSPGVERPLVRAADFERFAGKRVEVKTRAPIGGRKKFRGVLAGLSGDMIVVACDGNTVEIALDDIGAARLRPEFKL